MDKKVYEKTRYQNIYRHKKNKNYVIMMSKPVKTSISRIDKKKIMSAEDAIKVRDNVALKKQKATETLNKETFDELWDKYMFDCKNVKKLAYNSIIRKEKTYMKYLKEKIKIPFSKTNKNYWADYINGCECSNKQKNQILKELKALSNWCLEEEYIINSPVRGIQKWKVEKSEMKYWVPDEIKKFFDCVNSDLESEDLDIKSKAYLVKMVALIGFNLGDRIGETRALTFNCVSEQKETIRIQHSINYDTCSEDYLSNTKNYHSQREVDVTTKLIEEIKDYKMFLLNEMKYKVHDELPIIYNYALDRPYSDVTLRKYFHFYCDKAKVTRIRLYDLRHTYVATMMSENVELYQISERIGHNNYNTTVNKYGHLSNEVRKEIAKATDKYY